MSTICTRSCAVCEEAQKTPWSNLPPAETARLEASKTTLSFKRGDIIFKAGDPADRVFCVGEGQVQLFREGRSREQTFHICGPATWIGYRDALAGLHLQHNARCLTNVTICTLPRDLVVEFSQSYPDFSSAILGNLARGWVDSEQQSYNLGVRKTRERLADYLLQLAAEDADSVSSGETIQFPLTREVLATVLGTTTESVVRALSDFKARGWIATTRGEIRILKPVELERVVAEP